MRTTIEISDRHRSILLSLAAQKRCVFLDEIADFG